MLDINKKIKKWLIIISIIIIVIHSDVSPRV
jgi:hypothetical protein